MSDGLNAFLYVFAALFPVINPPGSGLVFLGIAKYSSSQVREAVARRIALYAFVLLVLSLFLGVYVLKIFGISVAVLSVAGGSVVTAMGWRLLHSQEDGRDDARNAEVPLKDLELQAFYPFTMPLTAGPGTIAVTVAIGTGLPSMDGTGRFVMFSIGAIAAAASICGAVYVCYAYADRIKRLTGETGLNIMLRLSAFILLCIGVQILWGGLRELWSSLPRLM